MTKIGILDYGLGNVYSLNSACIKIGQRPCLVTTAKEIEECDSLLLPGVGAFPEAMSRLQTRELDVAIRQHVDQGKSILGICLGMQLMFESSTEVVHTKGLGLVKGTVDIFSPKGRDALRLPHVGWNTCETSGETSNEFVRYCNGRDFYFVHSFMAARGKSDNIATCCYHGNEFCAAFSHERVFGTQFHPEKSGTAGLSLLKIFFDS